MSIGGSDLGFTSNVVVFSAGLNLSSPLNLAVTLYVPAVKSVIFWLPWPFLTLTV